MRFIRWIYSFILAAIFVGASAQAQGNSECISQTEMQEIAQHFQQFDQYAKGDYCLDNSPTSRLLSGIMFMRKTQFAPDMPASADDLFTGRFATSWWNYFIGRIDTFDVQASCPKGVIAYVYFFGQTMYVCPLALTASFSSLDLASVFMHEARHIDGFPHMTCSHGPRQGLNGACDDKIADGGSYAVTVETYAQLAKYAQGLHPALRAYSRSSSVVYADEAFESPVRIERETGFMVMTEDKMFHRVNFENGQLMVEDLGESPAVGRINMRGQHMVLFPEDRNLPAKYVFARNEGEIEQAAGDFAIDYNNSTPADRANWVDVHISAQWNARVFRNKLTFACNPRNVATQDVSTNGETPANVLYPSGYSRGSNFANLIMESGRIFEFGCNSGSPYLRASNLNYSVTFKRIHKSGNDVLGLSADGKLYKIDGNTVTPLNTRLDGQVHELAPNQKIDFLDR